MYRRDQKT